jgi:peptidoglycan/LPS O-acetylase OafA/YrhL
VLAVLIFHASEFTGRAGFGLGGRFAEVAGTEGVSVFFAISGFLLYRPYVAARTERRPAPSARRYARRRVLRILPAYWAVLTLLAIYPGITGVFTGDWWRYYLYLQVYATRTQTLGIPVAWTLCVEVSFYVALPLWAAALGRWSRLADDPARELLALAAVALGGVIVQCLAASHRIAYPIAVSLPGESTWLAIGMALAVISVCARTSQRRIPLPVPELSWAIGLGCVAALMTLVPRGGVFGLLAEMERPQSVGSTLVKVVLEAVLTAGLLLPAALPTSRRSAVSALLRWRPLALLGVISYSLYLWHFTIVELLARGADATGFSAHGWNVLAHIHHARTPVLAAIALVLGTVIATLSYRAIELPFLRRKERPAGATPARAPMLPRS